MLLFIVAVVVVIVIADVVVGVVYGVGHVAVVVVVRSFARKLAVFECMIVCFSVLLCACGIMSLLVA